MNLLHLIIHLVSFDNMLIERIRMDQRISESENQKITNR